MSQKIAQYEIVTEDDYTAGDVLTYTSELLIDLDEKKRALLEALIYKEKTIKMYKRFFPSNFFYLPGNYIRKSQIQLALAELEDNNRKRAFPWMGMWVRMCFSSLLLGTLSRVSALLPCILPLNRRQNF